MFDLEEIAKNSFKNFHARGLDYICLKRTPELTRKIYLFDGDITKLSEVVNPHDHRYSFKTTVLCGALRNSIYLPANYGTFFQEFEWRTPLNGGTGFTWKRQTMLRIVGMETYFPGESHQMSYEGIHTIKPLENQTVLLQEQYADQVPLDGVTLTFCPEREPPSLDGLYERFTPDEIINRLNRIEPLL